MDLKEETYLTGQWWVLTIQGIASILFGIAAVFWPGLTLLTFVYLFGVYLLVIGITSLLSGLFSITKRSTWILTVLLGLVEIGLGVYLLRHPTVSFAALILLTGSALVVFGVVEAVTALASRDQSAVGKTLSVVAGVVAVLAGVLMFFQPAASGIAFVWVIGLFALINGPLWIALSIDIKNAHNQLEAASAKKR